jgi:hypothetical protein
VGRIAFWRLPTAQKTNSPVTEPGYTKLDAGDEKSFRQWADKFTGGNTDNELKDYDLRGAWLKIKSGEIKPDARMHLTDEFKKPSHITFSDESKYVTPGMDPGKWRETGNGKWTFTVGKTNLEHHSLAELRDYFQKYEKDSTLIVPEHLK